jgi:uncharacterized protein (DUF58 family)
MPSRRHRHLDAETLAKLAGLQLRFKTVVEGTLAGIHPSPHYGSSIEFAEHKEYAPGDDLRHLDWKALAKFDRHYVKRYEDETDLKAYLVLDCSGSMEYGAPLSKLEYGSILAASLAFFLMRQGDQPGLVGYADRVRSYVPPRSRAGHLTEVLGALEVLEAGAATDLARAINYLTEVMGPRSLVIVVSDLFDTSADGLRLLRHLRARRHSVVVFHVLHADELSFPFSRVTLFESMEDTREVLVDPGGIRRAYLAEMERFLAEARSSCEEAEIEYHQVSTDDALDRVLLRFLSTGRGGRRA